MKYRIIALIGSIMLLTACSNKLSAPITESINFNSVDNIVSANESEANKDTPVQSVQYRIHIASDISKLKYDGSPINLDIEYITDKGFTGEMEFGFMLVSDGVPVKSVVDGADNILHKFKMSAEQTKKLSVSFVPYGKSGETIAIHPVSVLNPYFKLSDTQDKFYFYHSVLTTAPVEIKMEKDGALEYNFSNKYEKIIADKDTKQKYGITENDSDIKCLLWQDNTKSNNKLEIDDDGKGEFRFVVGGTNVNANIRVTFFLNSRPVTFNGGLNALDIGMFENYISYSDIILDEPVNKYDTVYAVICPCGSDYLKNVSLKKTISYSFEPCSGVSGEISNTTGSSSENNSFLSSENSVSTSGNSESVRVSLAGFDKSGSLYGVNINNDLVMIDKNTNNIIKTVSSDSGSISSNLQLSDGIIVRNSITTSGDFLLHKAEAFDENLNLVYSDTDIGSLAVSPNRSKVFYNESKGSSKYYLCDITGANKTEINLPENNIYISSAVFIDDNKIMFTGGDSNDSSMGNGVIGLYDTNSGSMKYERFPFVDSDILVFGKGAVFTENSENGQKIVLSDENFNLKKITTETPRETNRTAVSYNGKYICTAFTDFSENGNTKFRLYSAKSGEKISEQSYDGIEFGGIAVDNDGTVYACVGKSSDAMSIRGFSMN